MDIRVVICGDHAAANIIEGGLDPSETLLYRTPMPGTESGELFTQQGSGSSIGNWETHKTYAGKVIVVTRGG